MTWLRRGTRGRKTLSSCFKRPSAYSVFDLPQLRAPNIWNFDQTTDMANLRQVPLTCSGHTRPVVHLDFSDITDCGYFLISACKGELPPNCHAKQIQFTFCSDSDSFSNTSRSFRPPPRFTYALVSRSHIKCWLYKSCNLLFVYIYIICIHCVVYIYIYRVCTHLDPKTRNSALASCASMHSQNKTRKCSGTPSRRLWSMLSRDYRYKQILIHHMFTCEHHPNNKNKQISTTDESRFFPCGALI